MKKLAFKLKVKIGRDLNRRIVFFFATNKNKFKKLNIIIQIRMIAVRRA